MIVLWVAVGALIGAPARYLTDRAAQRRVSTEFPVGTFIVNMVASFALGWLAGTHALSPTVAALVGTGFCGALSTWSTFAYESVQLASRRERALAVAYVGATVAGGVVLAAAGWALAVAVSG